jgi:hypothetical protein
MLSSRELDRPLSAVSDALAADGLPAREPSGGQLPVAPNPRNSERV